MIGLDNFALVLPSSCDYFACTFPPFSIDLFEVMGSCPLSYYSFVLLWGFFRYIGYGSTLDKHFSREYNNILVIFFALVVIRLPR